jgi:3-phosphoshikimate 1-carboxyvinyltransferase
MKIASARRLVGTIDVPGDKSISHRAALISALAHGTSTIENFSTGQDCAATLGCLSELGVNIERDGTTICVQGSKLRPPARALDCGNSGSTMRMIAGVLAAQNFESTLAGDVSLSARPMKRIVAPLEQMGAQIRTNNGCPPLNIHGQEVLTAIRYEMPVASAQVKTSLLLAALSARGRTIITEPVFTRDHTERMLRWFGVPVSTTDEARPATTSVEGPVSFNAANVKIPGDFSSAAYLLVAAAMLPGSEVEIKAVGLNPTRIQLLDVLRAVNAGVEISDMRDDSNEPVGTIRIRGNSLAPREPSNVIDGELIVAMIDELPLLAVLGTQIPGGLIFRNAGELRVKETDRIETTTKNLRAMGAQVDEFEDGFAVNGPVPLNAARIHSYGDHRIALAFSIAALVADGESEIIDSECVAVSFPDFYTRLESLAER